MGAAYIRVSAQIYDTVQYTFLDIYLLHDFSIIKPNHSHVASSCSTLINF